VKEIQNIRSKSPKKSMNLIIHRIEIGTIEDPIAKNVEISGRT